MSDNRRYGYLRCSSCKEKWESSHVYVKEGTKKVEFGQECKKCNIVCFPYHVEPIQCSLCGQTGCDCQKERHIDPAKAHRADLCMRCRAGLFCDKRN
ncbi:zygote arrest protein 2.L [Patella vulgata]|uniref:zygote arrest protein 2.L n=1 Tax=Patella vulgata TaxID=6465 RepID=UPI00217FE5A3|nr:zygote arrest protein 2.L [Patella vulgata]